MHEVSPVISVVSVDRMAASCFSTSSFLSRDPGRPWSLPARPVAQRQQRARAPAINARPWQRAKCPLACVPCSAWRPCRGDRHRSAPGLLANLPAFTRNPAGLPGLVILGPTRFSRLQTMPAGPAPWGSVGSASRKLWGGPTCSSRTSQPQNHRPSRRGSPWPAGIVKTFCRYQRRHRHSLFVAVARPRLGRHANWRHTPDNP